MDVLEYPLPKVGRFDKRCIVNESFVNDEIKYGERSSYHFGGAKENNHDFQLNQKHGDKSKKHGEQTRNIKCQNECNSSIGECFDLENINPKKIQEYREHQDPNTRGILDLCDCINTGGEKVGSEIRTQSFFHDKKASHGSFENDINYPSLEHEYCEQEKCESNIPPHKVCDKYYGNNSNPPNSEFIIDEYHRKQLFNNCSPYLTHRNIIKSHLSGKLLKYIKIRVL